MGWVMARARNIKPSFFTNDDLSELNPLARLLFIGMWTIADYKGCFEYKPKRLKVQLLPYDDCDTEQLVSDLEKSGFISIYSVQGQQYGKVINFSKHQNPHKNERERGSEIPDITMADQENPVFSKHLEIIENNPDQNGTDRADSLNLIPDSLNLIPNSNTSDVVEKTASPKFVFKTELKKLGVSEESAAEFIQVRKAKKAVNTKNALDCLVREAGKANLTLAQAVDYCLKRQKPWAGFEASWYVNEQMPSQNQFTSNQTQSSDSWAAYNQQFAQHLESHAEQEGEPNPKKLIQIEGVGHA